MAEPILQRTASLVLDSPGTFTEPCIPVGFVWLFVSKDRGHSQLSCSALPAKIVFFQ